MAGYIKDLISYPIERLNFFEQVIAGSFEDIFREILDTGPFWATEIARRFANGNLTPQEAEALRKLLLGIRSKAGTTNWLMRKLIIAIMNFLVTRDEISPEEAVELVPGTLEALREDYMSVSDDNKSGDSTSRSVLLLVLENGCLDNTDVSNVQKAYPHLDMVAAHHELVEHQPNKLNEKLSKLVPNLLSLHGSGATRVENDKLLQRVVDNDITLTAAEREQAARVLQQRATLKARYAQKKQEIERIKAMDASKRSADEKATLAKYEKYKADKAVSDAARRASDNLLLQRDVDGDATLTATDHERIDVLRRRIAEEETAMKSQQSAKAARMAADKEAEDIRNYANDCRQWLVSQGYTHRYITAMPGRLGISFTSCIEGWLRVKSVHCKSQLKHKVSENDIIMSINEVDVIHMEDGDARLDSILLAVENSKEIEIWTK